MSSDNFWFTRDGKVYMGFLSNFCERDIVQAYVDGILKTEKEWADAKDQQQAYVFAVELAEKQILDEIVKRGRTYFEGTPEEANEWANREYAEYGYWGER